MRTVLDRDHDLLGEEEPSSDLVLGAPALLGIFFALALICAVCFGFGYSSGHGLHSLGQVLPSAATAPAAQPKPSASEIAPEDGEVAAASQDSADDAGPAAQAAASTNASERAVAKPAPGVNAAGVNTQAQITPEAAAVVPSATVHVPVTSRATTAQQIATAAQSPARTGALSPSAIAAPASTVVPASEGLNLMVQIAAVSHAADAETLATALRHDGFSAIVRTVPGDPFFHVQVGPFSSREAAKTMRTRLAGSGYNAFIKQ
jgi:DedD protein